MTEEIRLNEKDIISGNDNKTPYYNVAITDIGDDDQNQDKEHKFDCDDS